MSEFTQYIFIFFLFPFIEFLVGSTFIYLFYKIGVKNKSKKKNDLEKKNCETESLKLLMLKTISFPSIQEYNTGYVPTSMIGKESVKESSQLSDNN